MVQPGWGLMRRKQRPVAALFYGEPVVGVNNDEQRLKIDATMPCPEGALIRLLSLLYQTIINKQQPVIMLSGPAKAVIPFAIRR